MRSFITWIHQRIKDDPHFALTVFIHSIIPLVTLIISIWGSLTFWTAILGSWLLAIGIMIAVESAGVLGFVLYIWDISPRSRFQRFRHVLPFLPMIPIAHTIHQSVIPSSIVHDVFVTFRITPDTTAWGIATALTTVALGIAWFGWEELGTLLRDRATLNSEFIAAEQARRITVLLRQREQIDAEETVKSAESNLAMLRAIRTISDRLRELSWQIPETEATLRAMVAEREALESALRHMRSVGTESHSIGEAAKPETNGVVVTHRAQHHHLPLAGNGIGHPILDTHAAREPAASTSSTAQTVGQMKSTAGTMGSESQSAASKEIMSSAIADVAAGKPMRRVASDYKISYTTLRRKVQSVKGNGKNN